MMPPAFVLVVAAQHAEAHFSMNMPPSFHDPESAFLWAGGQTAAGCTGKRAPGESEAAEGCVAEWYSNHTFIPGEPTIIRDSAGATGLLTYQDACQSGRESQACCASPCTDMKQQQTGMPCVGCDWTRKMPWRAPGTAPVFSPCGFDGGNPQGCPVGNPNGGGCAGGGYGHGPDGRTLGGRAAPTVWMAGSVVEVATGVTANHGGGYSFRLCPKPSEGYMHLTEECFQQTPLRFVGDEQWIQNGEHGVRIAIPAVRTDKGTFPAGSQWTRNPIPACGGTGGGAPASGQPCTGTQFPPPAAGVFGFGSLPWSIIDTVQVPNIAPGDYVIGARFDCEQTSQVWQQCGDVRIVAPTPTPSHTYSPTPSPERAGCMQQCGDVSIAACKLWRRRRHSHLYAACVKRCEEVCDSLELI